jgi:hypothetical protein
MISADLVFFDAGGGHRSAAEALRLVMEEQGGWNVRMTNLQELLDPIDLVRRLTGLRLQDLYNLTLKKGWTFGAAQGLYFLHVLIRLWHGEQVRILSEYWRETQPQLVVSLIPNFNRALAESLSRAQPATPFVTILTDFADYPPHFWIERQEQFFISGSERAVRQAAEMGIRPDRVFRVSGMILHPRFYQPIVCDRGGERARRGLDPNLPTGLVLFGGQGSEAMLEIAERLDAASLDLQLVFICGRNERLAETLRLRRGRLRSFVEGFTKQVPFYMHLCDFLIGKPGPGSLSEAIAMGLPVIVERNAWTLPQERYNADWVLEKQVGLVVRGPREIPGAVKLLLDPANFPRFRARAAAIRNRAVYEIPETLRSIVEGTSGVTAADLERSLREQRA